MRSTTSPRRCRTRTHVEPVTIDILGEHAFARLIYEETVTHANGHVTTGVWRIVELLKRYGDTWQLLENSMVSIAEMIADAGGEETGTINYRARCPQ